MNSRLDFMYRIIENHRLWNRIVRNVHHAVQPTMPLIVLAALDLDRKDLPHPFDDEIDFPVFPRGIIEERKPVRGTPNHVTFQ